MHILISLCSSKIWFLMLRRVKEVVSMTQYENDFLAWGLCQWCDMRIIYAWHFILCNFCYFSCKWIDRYLRLYFKVLLFKIQKKVLIFFSRNFSRCCICIFLKVLIFGICTQMFACFVGFGVVVAQEAYWGEACKRGWKKCQARGQKEKILGKKFVILDYIF